MRRIGDTPPDGTDPPEKYVPKGYYRLTDKAVKEGVIVVCRYNRKKWTPGERVHFVDKPTHTVYYAKAEKGWLEYLGSEKPGESLDAIRQPPDWQDGDGEEGPGDGAEEDAIRQPPDWQDGDGEEGPGDVVERSGGALVANVALERVKGEKVKDEGVFALIEENDASFAVAVEGGKKYLRKRDGWRRKE